MFPPRDISNYLEKRIGIIPKYLKFVKNGDKYNVYTSLEMVHKKGKCENIEYFLRTKVGKDMYEINLKLKYTK